MSCLRRWRRMVLVSQPTHPAFHEDDVRHHECNVCGQVQHSSPDAPRAHGDVHGRGDRRADRRGVRHRLPPRIRRRARESAPTHGPVPKVVHRVPALDRRRLPHHRRRGGRREEEITLRNVDSLKAVKERVERSVVEGAESGSGSGVVRLEIVLGSKRLRLVPGGSLANVTPEDLPRAFDALDKTPVTLFFARGEGAPDCGEDHVAAVNHAAFPSRRAGRERDGGAAETDVSAAAEIEEQTKETRRRGRRRKRRSLGVARHRPGRERRR